MVTSRRACSGTLAGRSLFDVGFGVMARIREADVPLASIERLFVSHTHADHIGDFAALLWAMQLEGRRDGLEVVSTKETEARLKEILRLQSTPRVFFGFDVRYVRPEDAGARSVYTKHLPKNAAYAVEIDGKELVYTGDTARSQRLVGLSRGCDLLIHEATFLESQAAFASKTNHSTAADAAWTAAESGARALAMVHISPANEGRDDGYLAEARREYGGRAFVASDLMPVDV
jgi:ribonuclease Z